RRAGQVGTAGGEPVHVGHVGDDEAGLPGVAQQRRQGGGRGPVRVHGEQRLAPVARGRRRERAQLVGGDCGGLGHAEADQALRLVGERRQGRRDGGGRAGGHGTPHRRTGTASGTPTIAAAGAVNNAG